MNMCNIIICFCSQSDMEHCNEKNWMKCNGNGLFSVFTQAKLCDQVPNAKYHNYNCFPTFLDYGASFDCLNRVDKYPEIFHFDRPPIQGQSGKFANKFGNRKLFTRE